MGSWRDCGCWLFFSSIFQNASSAYIVFTVNKSLELKLKGTCSKVVFMEGVEAVARLSEAPLGLPWPKPMGTGMILPYLGLGEGAEVPQTWN